MLYECIQSLALIDFLGLRRKEYGVTIKGYLDLFLVFPISRCLFGGLINSSGSKTGIDGALDVFLMCRQEQINLVWSKIPDE
jgi:hypothetical protein